MAAQRSVVAVGTFDGVHRGHRRLVARALDLAREGGHRAVALTFDPHPSAVVRPGTEPPLLGSLAHRVALLSAMGVDVEVVEFTPDLASWSPQRFVEDILVRRLRAATVVVGANFRFGHRAAGDVDTLVDLGTRAPEGDHFTVEVVGLLTGSGGVWSSTYVRGLVAAGDVAAAAESLGRPHRVEGVVVHGDARGRTIGYPTANLAVPAGRAIPADGVYAGWLIRSDGSQWPTAISIGTNPTFDGVHRRVEGYVLDAPSPFDLYDEAVAFDFVARLRGTEKFDSVEALIERIEDDVRRTRAIVG